MSNSIGAYSFDNIAGALFLRQPQVQVYTREGVAGESLHNTGVRAEPSTITTEHFVADRASALTAIDTYRTMIDGGKYQITQHGQSFGYFKILRLRELPLLSCVNAIGTIVSNPTIYQRIEWTVVATTPPA